MESQKFESFGGGGGQGGIVELKFWEASFRSGWLDYFGEALFWAIANSAFVCFAWYLFCRPGKAVRANRTRASADRSHHSTFVPQEWRESGGAESRGAFRDISNLA